MHEAVPRGGMQAQVQPAPSCCAAHPTATTGPRLQVLFYCLDSLPVILCLSCYIVFHPGYLLPAGGPKAAQAATAGAAPAGANPVYDAPAGVAFADAIAKVRSLMAEYGLTLADLGGKPPGAGPKGKAGGKVPAKYRNAATGESWSGRGLQPNWLKAALASGRSLDDFKV